MTKFSIDTKDTLERAAIEIEQLRRSNEILGAKVEVMELFGMALRATDHRNNCMSEDILWRIRGLVNEIESDRVARAS